jgi:flagellar biosynthesis/type III secretory pathway M-ring protein FliF/YscJ
MQKMTKLEWFVVAALVAVVCVIVFGRYLEVWRRDAENAERQRVKQQFEGQDRVWENRAVREGHAVWAMGPDGRPEFKWLPPCGVTKKEDVK